MIRFLNAHFPTRTLILGISEACLVGFAFAIAMIARLGVSDASVQLSDEQGLLKILIVSATFIICMYYFDLYDSSILSNRRELATRLIQVLGSVCVLLSFFYYVYPPMGLGRGIFLIGFLLGTVISVALAGVVLSHQQPTAIFRTCADSRRWPTSCTPNS